MQQSLANIVGSGRVIKMRMWGKIIGGAAGLAIGGPLGALMGAAAGHALDRMGDDALLAEPEVAVKSAAFTIGVIALAAKMAKADGEVTRDEVRAFHKLFRVEEEDQADVDRFFDLARRSSHGFEVYARQVAKLFEPGSPVLEELLDTLFEIARADGKVPDSEIAYLSSVAAIFGFDAEAFDRLRRFHLGAEECMGDPWCLLGVPRGADEETVRGAYRRLASTHHPDRLIAAGMPEEALAVANEKMARINAAYDAITRGLPAF